jgi:hypothetical protein
VLAVETAVERAIYHTRTTTTSTTTRTTTTATSASPQLLLKPTHHNHHPSVLTNHSCLFSGPFGSAPPTEATACGVTDTNQADTVYQPNQGLKSPGREQHTAHTHLPPLALCENRRAPLPPAQPAADGRCAHHPATLSTRCLRRIAPCLAITGTGRPTTAFSAVPAQQQARRDTQCSPTANGHECDESKTITSVTRLQRHQSCDVIEP